MNTNNKNSTQSTLGMHIICLCMLYFMLDALSFVFFNQIVSIEIFSFQWQIPGALIPYIFSYPIAYIVLKVYGYPVVRNLIVSMIIIGIIFITFCNLMLNLPVTSNSTGVINDLKPVFDSSFRLYMAGLIAMPAGAYTSLQVVRALRRKIHRDYSLYIISTLVGELINTILVILIGFWGVYSFETIFSQLIVSGYIFKAIAALITTPMAVYGVVYLKDLAKKGKI